MHRKRGSFGLIPLGARVKYYCPVKNDRTTLKTDYVSRCPLCGERVNWGRIDR